MEKINFTNNVTPAGAGTMNTFQDNIENAINDIIEDKSLTENGYQKIGDLIIQWGNLEVTVNNTQQDATFPFSIPFPNACFTAVACISDPGSGSTTFTGTVGVSSLSNSNATLRIKSTSSFVSGRTVLVRVIAIGH